MADNNYLSYQEDSGSINISEEVILTIVRGAALDVKGVSSLSTTAGAELAELIGLKTIPKGSTCYKHFYGWMYSEIYKGMRG